MNIKNIGLTSKLALRTQSEYYSPSRVEIVRNLDDTSPANIIARYKKVTARIIYDIEDITLVDAPLFYNLLEQNYLANKPLSLNLLTNFSEGILSLHQLEINHIISSWYNSTEGSLPNDPKPSFKDLLFNTAEQRATFDIELYSALEYLTFQDHIFMLTTEAALTKRTYQGADISGTVASSVPRVWEVFKEPLPVASNIDPYNSRSKISLAGIMPELAYINVPIVNNHTDRVLDVAVQIYLDSNINGVVFELALKVPVNVPKAEIDLLLKYYKQVLIRQPEDCLCSENFKVWASSGYSRIDAFHSKIYTISSNRFSLPLFNLLLTLAKIRNIVTSHKFFDVNHIESKAQLEELVGKVEQDLTKPQSRLKDLSCSQAAIWLLFDAYLSAYFRKLKNRQQTTQGLILI